MEHFIPVAGASLNSALLYVLPAEVDIQNGRIR